MQATVLRPELVAATSSVQPASHPQILLQYDLWHFCSHSELTAQSIVAHRNDADMGWRTILNKTQYSAYACSSYTAQILPNDTHTWHLLHQFDLHAPGMKSPAGRLLLCPRGTDDGYMHQIFQMLHQFSHCSIMPYVQHCATPNAQPMRHNILLYRATSGLRSPSDAALVNELLLRSSCLAQEAIAHGQGHSSTWYRTGITHSETLIRTSQQGSNQTKVESVESTDSMSTARALGEEETLAGAKQ